MSLGGLYPVSFERGFSARTLIGVAIVLVLLPALLVTGWLAHVSASAERAQVEQNMQQRAHEISAILDREVSGVKGTLTAMATSASLHNGNLQGFHVKAVEVAQQLGLRIILYDVRNDKTVLSTATPFGSSLQDGVSVPRALLDKFLSADGPFVTGVALSPRLKVYGVSVIVPVRTTEPNHYVLGAVIDASKIAQVFDLVGLKAPYLSAIVDRNATFVARSSRHDEFVGQPVPTRLPAEAGNSGTVGAQTLEGVDYRWFYQRSAITNWTVVVGAPEEAFNTSLTAVWRRLAGAAVVLIAVGLAIAYGLGGRFSRAASELGIAVRGLPHRPPPPTVSSTIREANDILHALNVASADLRATDAQQRFAIEAAGIGTWTWDLVHGRIVWSKRTREMYRLPPDQEPSADFFWKAVHPADRERLVENKRRCLDDRNEYKIEFRILNPDGETCRWLQSDGHVERDAAGTALFIHGTTCDITERKESEQERLELRRRLLGAQEAERVRLAHELHDQTGQSLTAALLEVKQIGASVGGDGNVHVVRLRHQLEAMGKTVHRIAHELRPTALEDLGLRAALANHLSEWSAQYGIASDFDFRCKCDEGPDSIPDDVRTAIYRIAQETLTNVAKHATGATAVSLIVDCGEDLVQMTIEDNGCGFDTTQCPKRDSGYSGLGLPGMRERAALVGGSLEVESSIETGTTVFLRVPIEKRRCVA